MSDNIPDQESKTKPSDESLRCQLVELNNRSRWYTAQLWQLPLAWAGVFALTIGGFIGNGKIPIPILICTLFVFVILGITLLCHMWHMREGERRAVENMKAIEVLLKLNIKTSITTIPTNYFPWNGFIMFIFQIGIILLNIVFLIYIFAIHQSLTLTIEACTR